MLSNSLLEKARHSKFYLWVLNTGLSRMIPFNKPHGFKVLELGDYHLKTRLPYRKKNLNHIRGIHACALATLSEYTSGLLLISKLGFSQYRIILQRLEMDYHYQGKMDAEAVYSINQQWLDEKIFQPLKQSESVIITCEVKIHDVAGNHLTTGKVHWQIKEWKRVKTKT